MGCVKALTVAATIVTVGVGYVSAQESTFSGRIINEAEDPVAGNVTAFANHGGLVSSTVVAGSDGIFVIALPAKPDRLLVWADDYAPLSIDDPAPEGTIVLSRLQTVEVQVMDWDGVPVANAPTAIWYGESGGIYVPDWMDGQHFATDRAGRFTAYEVIPHAEITLAVVHEGVLYDPDHVRVESNHSMLTAAAGGRPSTAEAGLVAVLVKR